MALLDLHKLLLEKKKTVAFAESCTGGRMAAEITGTPGASTYFLGSIVVYSEEFKRSFLHVPEKLLREKGAVSEEVAKAMLTGLFEVTSADFGVAVTGIAGPTGGTLEQPVGTIWTAIGERRKPLEVFTFHSAGKNREEVLREACTHLFEKLLALLLRS